LTTSESNSSSKKQPKLVISIRLADYHNKVDARAIIGLLDHYARQAEGGEKPLSSFAIKNLIPELQKINGALSIIAFDGGKPIGLINCFQTFSTFKCKPVLNIHDVIVREDYRRQGIAKDMFKLLQAHAKEAGCCKLTLEVLSKNSSAMALYKSLGFNAYELIPRMGQALFWEKVL